MRARLALLGLDAPTPIAKLTGEQGKDLMDKLGIKTPIQKQDEANAAAAQEAPSDG